MKLLVRGLEQICNADKTAASLVKARLPEITGTLDRYIDEIERFNSAYGLVKVTGRDELIVKHVLDSLAPLGHIARLLEKETPIDSQFISLAGKTLADLGSGAGFPGIPLAVCMPQLKVVLIERMRRRADFLRNTAAVLKSAVSGSNLVNVAVEETELERVSGAFDLVTFRALSPLAPAFVSVLARFCKSSHGSLKNGVIAAYKGKYETASAELEGLAAYTTELVPLEVPFLDEERCLALIRV